MANVSFVLDAEEAKAVNAFLKVVDAQKKAEAGFNRLNAKTDEHSKKQENLGSIALSSVAKMAGAWLSIESAISAATAVLDKYHEAQDRAANTVKSTADARGALFQLSGGAAKAAEAEKMAATTGMDLTQAYKTQFQISSGDLTESDRQALVDAMGWAGNQEELSTTFISARSAMGEKETGGLRQVLAKAITASEYSNADISGLMQGLAGTGGAVAAIGGSDEEALAYLAKFTDVYGADQAKTFVNSMATSIQEKGMQGMGFHKAILKINEQYRKLSGDERITYMAREESRKGFDVLTPENIGIIEKTMGAVQGANHVDFNDVVGRRKAEYWSDPINAALMGQKQAERAQEVAEMQRRAVGSLGMEATVAREIEGSNRRGEGKVASAMREAGMGIAKRVGYSEDTVRGAGDLAADLASWEGAKGVASDLGGWAGEGVNATLKSIEKLLAGILQKDNPAPKPTPNLQAE